MGKAKYSFKRKKNDFYTSRPAVDANPACTAVMSSAVCFWAAPPQIECVVLSFFPVSLQRLHQGRRQKSGIKHFYLRKCTRPVFVQLF